MNRINGFTPKEFAYEIAISWILAVHNERTGDLQSLTDSQRLEVQKHLAKLHDQLLSKSGLDGFSIGKNN